ncbi:MULTISPECIES: adenylate/guanylate cyclase domain-containing protein [unclassified Marinobacterium]|uniref:adenylate/guanylate cyclase domain-containing protein n=1 Tax=unclassified Marinobacterium TaxID=2644139 RepID=UPI00156A19F8|nr:MULTISPECIES: adenylate/guanylate cyclase domain-containing protein [unclassified Marinobacterium]NRP10372.1 Adenylate and Guanylate cyclase catalytic domain protein [Marinobacterium sp. xm-g-48]NRP83471.1 Adenylate and Guanylate cyclase catalytic domain protein [Marinobacterium sp. xm-d-509]
MNFKKYQKPTRSMISVTDSQLPEEICKLLKNQVQRFRNSIEIVESNSIPHTKDMPGTGTDKWLKIKGPICVSTDMANSTALSAKSYPKQTAKVYQLYTDTATKLFHSFDARYIDINGDGVFAMFDSNQPYSAFCSAVAFKTFFGQVFIDTIKSIIPDDIELGNHIGIDQRTILVKKLGLRKYGERGDKQNEVWAGRTVNMASKLASLKSENTVIVSDRFFENLSHEDARLSCGCDGSGQQSSKTYLWHEHDLSNDAIFDFDKAFVLNTNGWCKIHGTETIKRLLDEES